MTPNLNHQKGALSELQAAHFFTSKGYSVYMPLDGHAKADLVVLKDGKYLGVQVKTARMEKTTPRQPNPGLVANTGTWNRKNRWRPEDAYDILFIVFGGRMWSIPVSEVGDLWKLTLWGPQRGERYAQYEVFYDEEET